MVFPLYFGQNQDILVQKAKQKKQQVISHFSDKFDHLAPSSAWTKSDLTHVLLSAAYTLNWWPREYNQKFFLLKVKVGPVDRSQISLVFGLRCQCLIRAHGRKYSRINVSKFLQLLIAVKDLLWNNNEIYALTKYDLLEEFILKHHNKEAISEDS